MTIDILMATYNGEKFIEEQIYSILNQRIKNFRLLISDDCSTDKTVEIISNIAKKDSRITLYRQKKNLGYVKNFEKLLEISNAQYILFSDQDDIWDPQKLEFFLNKIKSSDVDLVYGNFSIINEKNDVVFLDYWRKGSINPLKGNPTKECFQNNIVPGCNIIITRNLKEKILPFYAVYSHDWFITFIASLNKGIDYISLPMLQYRIHDNNQLGLVKFNDLVRNFSNKNYSFSYFCSYRKQFIERYYINGMESNLVFLSKKGYSYNEYFKQYTFHKKCIENKLIMLNIFSFKKYHKKGASKFKKYFIEFLLLMCPIICYIGLVFYSKIYKIK